MELTVDGNRLIGAAGDGGVNRGSLLSSGNDICPQLQIGYFESRVLA